MEPTGQPVTAESRSDGDPPNALMAALVAALVLPPASGDEAPALLIQQNEDDAAVALRDRQQLVVFLVYRATKSPGEDVIARVDAALAADGAEVVEGTQPGFVHVVLLGGRVDRAALPALHPRLERALSYY